MRFYISDLHFYHANMNSRMDNRGFKDVEEMNNFMISQWNSRVRKNDEVVILGDFSWAQGEDTNEILKQLNGRKFLIKGNHDYYLKDHKFNRSYYEWVKDYAEVNDNGRKVILSHYPLFCYPGQYRKDTNGNAKTYMLFGHVHNTFDMKLVDDFKTITRNTLRQAHGYKDPQPIPCNMINCFCMYSNYIPLTLDEWIELDEKRMKEGKYENA